MKNKKLLFFYVGVILVSAFIFATKFYKNQESDRISFLALQNSELFVRSYSPTLGESDARVYLVEYLDPECESCRRFYPEVKKVLKEFEGKVKLVVRYAAFHKNSKIAIRALEASRKQGKYWESLKVLFETQPKWGDHHNPQIEKIYDFLPQAGVDIVKLKEDMKDPQINKIIEQDNLDLQTLGVRGTPTFYVNGKMLQNFSAEGLRALIQEKVDSEY